MIRRINVGGPNNVLTCLFEKAFIAYMRSVYLQKNKDIFKVHELPAEEFAQSIGLPGAPKIKFVKASAKASAAKEAQRVEAMAKLTVAAKASDGEESSSEEESEPEESVLQAKVGKKATPWREAINEQSKTALTNNIFFSAGTQTNFKDRKDVPQEESEYSLRTL